MLGITFYRFPLTCVHLLKIHSHSAGFTVISGEALVALHKVMFQALAAPACFGLVCCSINASTRRSEKCRISRERKKRTAFAVSRKLVNVIALEREKATWRKIFPLNFVFATTVQLLCTFAAMTTLLALSVFQIIVSDKLPSSSKAVPIVGQWTSLEFYSNQYHNA